MQRNEIRLKRHMLSSGRIARYRNYRELMRLYDREVRLKKILRVFLYFLIILFLLILLIMVFRWEERVRKKTLQPVSMQDKGSVQQGEFLRL